MSFPFSIQRSELSLPENRFGHVAVTWDNAIIIWGGAVNTHGYEVPTSLVDYHLSGKWTRIGTSGDAPSSSLHIERQAQVLHDKMFLLDAHSQNKPTMYSLDLRTWQWKSFLPTGIDPKHTCCTNSWTHNDKIYYFGGITNDARHKNA